MGKMKLIIAVVQDKDVGRLLDLLMKKHYRATKLSSTGGFLRNGNTTLLIGVEEAAVEDVLQIIRTTCRSRREYVTPVPPAGGPAESYIPFPVEVVLGGATIFLVDVEKMEKI
jgi:uncharacterized protein YaaQ